MIKEKSTWTYYAPKINLQFYAKKSWVIFLPSVWTLRFHKNILTQCLRNLQKAVVITSCGIAQKPKIVVGDIIVGILLEQIVSLFIKPLLICVFLIECGDRRDHQRFVSLCKAGQINRPRSRLLANRQAHWHILGKTGVSKIGKQMAPATVRTSGQQPRVEHLLEIMSLA